MNLMIPNFSWVVNWILSCYFCTTLCIVFMISILFLWWWLFITVESMLTSICFSHLGCPGCWVPASHLSSPGPWPGVGWKSMHRGVGSAVAKLKVATCFKNERWIASQGTFRDFYMDFLGIFPKMFLLLTCFGTWKIGFHYLHMYLSNWILYLDFTSHILCIFSVVYALHVTVSVENDSVCCAYENQQAVVGVELQLLSIELIEPILYSMNL